MFGYYYDPTYILVFIGAIICMVARRVPRKYICEGKVVSTVNYLTE